MRLSGRNNDEIRPTVIIPSFNPFAEGSCLIKQGNTHVVCTATIDEDVPPFLKGQGTGWVTAEYGMLPRSTGTRIRRDSTNGRPNGRTQEIQRIVGRCLRAAVDLKALGKRQVIIDCDVIQADGGTRCASVTGGYVALCLAINKALKRGLIKTNPIINQIAAISCGIVAGKVVADLDYLEDSSAEVDANFIIAKDKKIIEIGASAEKSPFSEKQLIEMLKVANVAIEQIHAIQLAAIK
jgi:ribonuclease PH